MQTQRVSGAAALAVGVAGLTADSAPAQDYDFVNLADTSGIYSSVSSPMINNRGTATFGASLDAGGSGLFVTSGAGTAGTIADLSGPFNNLSGLAPINDAGTAGFFAGFDAGGSGILTRNGGGAIITVADTAGPYSTFFSHPGINASGRLTFAATLDAGDSGVFARDGGSGATTVIADVAGQFSSLIGRPSINAGGTVAFLGFLDAGGLGVFTGAGGPTTTIATNNGPLAGIGDPVINAAGTVAFVANLDAGGTTLFAGNGGPLVPFVSTTGPFSDFGFQPGINDNGTIVFQASLDAGGSGVFTGPDPDADKIIRTGDVLFGSTVSSAGAAGGLNNLGDVGFRYVLADGTIGAAVAITGHRYVADASGSFDNAANFAFGAVPRDVVPTFITPANGLIITGPAAATTLRSLTIGTAGSGVAELRLQPFGQLNINQTLTVQAKGKLRIDGVASALGGVSNQGEIELVNDAQLNGGALVNTGVLRGDGTVGNAVTNQGRIEAIGTASDPAELRFTTTVSNAASSGLIVVRNGALRFDAGLANSGSLGVSFGASDIFGDVVNTGAIQVSGGAQATFYDDLTQNGTMQVVKVGSTTSVAVLFGAFTGAGGFTGGGDVFALGDLRPGNSPGAVTYDGNLLLGSSSHTFIELGGTASGEFDQMLVTGELALDGALSVALIDGFDLDPNQQFVIADVGDALTGTFSGLGEGALVGNFGGIDLFITYAAGAGNDVALFTVPEPGGLTLVGAAALALLKRRTRRSRR